MSTGSGLQLPGVKHKVIGLVSGGKDSCFNLIHCVANGHELAAIATLQPEAGIDELDSHLYQSVGTQMLPLIAQAMDLPLYTGLIKGKAVERGPEYGDRSNGGEGSGTTGDETEDLTALLKRVMVAHPDATALASGAILSNYQRIRIEHVCGRLGLVSLAYLWQQPQTPLLESMFRSGLSAILVKVAGVGLGVDLVGRDLQSTMPALRKLERLYGSHPAGEGGEYETLTLDSPLFSHRVRIVNSEVVITDPEPYPVAYLRIHDAVLEVKEGWTRPGVTEIRELLGMEQLSDGLNEHGREVLDDMGESSVKPAASHSQEDLTLAGITVSEPAEARGAWVKQTGRWFSAGVDGRTEDDKDIGSELRKCFEEIKSSLSERGLSLPLHSTHITLLLSSMSLFVPANEVYKTYFGTSPPSRATVAVPLPSGQRVKVEVLGYDDTPNEGSSSKLGGRQALHVQSLSYWAPANIGPYSQAVIVDSRINIAGQIPLIPAPLTLPPSPTTTTSPYSHQAALAVQHVGSIIDVLRSKNNTGGGWTGWGESCVAWWARTPHSGEEGLGIVKEAWKTWAERNDWCDVPAVFVRAAELPKGALVEYQVNMHTGRQSESQLQSWREDVKTRSGVDESDDDDEEELQGKHEHGKSAGVSWELSTTNNRSRASRTIIFCRGVADNLASSLDSLVLDTVRRAVAVKVYYPTARSRLSIEQAVASFWQNGKQGVNSGVTFVPVLDVHDRYGVAADFALDAFAT